MNLDNKKILLTGAGGLLGRTYIKSMLDAGAIVIATELPGKRADALCKLYGSDKNFFYFDLDVSSEDEIEKLFKHLKYQKYIPNVFINNAAITGELLMGSGKKFPNLSNTKLEDWKKTIDVNLTGPFLIARQIDRDIVRNNKITLINIASMYALNAPHHEIYNQMPFKSFSAYSASKAGVHGLTLWLSSYWSKWGANVNTLAPGAVFNGHSDVFQKRISKLLMLKRMADPSEISKVILFLCSDNSRYMTGQLINVDGGFSAW